jgi:hypothetical protein
VFFWPWHWECTTNISSICRLQKGGHGRTIESSSWSQAVTKLFTMWTKSSNWRRLFGWLLVSTAQMLAAGITGWGTSKLTRRVVGAGDTARRLLMTSMTSPSTAMLYFLWKWKQKTCCLVRRETRLQNSESGWKDQSLQKWVHVLWRGI